MTKLGLGTHTLLSNYRRYQIVASSHVRRHEFRGSFEKRKFMHDYLRGTGHSALQEETRAQMNIRFECL